MVQERQPNKGEPITEEWLKDPVSNGTNWIANPISSGCDGWVARLTTDSLVLRTWELKSAVRLETNRPGTAGCDAIPLAGIRTEAGETAFNRSSGILSGALRNGVRARRKRLA